VVIISAEFFGNLLRLAWISAFFASDSCQERTAVRAASHPRWNYGMISVTGSVIDGFRGGFASITGRLVWGIA
jgi:hypothetical protein